LAYNSRTEVQKDKGPLGRSPLPRTARSWRCRSIGLLIRRVRVCEPTPTEERKPAWRAVAAPLGGGKRGSGECHRLRNALAQWMVLAGCAAPGKAACAAGVGRL